MRRPLLLGFGGYLLSLVFCLPKSFSDSPIQNAEFVYARIRYHMTSAAWRVREVPWHHDYPYADETFPTVLAEVTNVKTASTSYKIVDIDSSELFEYPFAYLCEPGYLELNDKDVVNLRRYLDRGGFLFVDDFRTADFSRQAGGEPEDDIANFRKQMKTVYPDRDFVRLTLSDPIFNAFYKIESLDMEPPYMPDKDQYVVTTSEFNQVKALLAQLENRRTSAEQANKPSLRRRTQQPDANSKDDDGDRTTTSTKTSKDKKDSSKDSTIDSTKPEDQEPSDDDRPKLKRRD